MTTAQLRAAAAILGGFVADAATMPLNLIYDQINLKEIELNRTNQRKEDDNQVQGLEFYDKCLCPFYNIEVGNFSPQGDEVVPLLRSISEIGYFEKGAATDEMLQHYMDNPDDLSRLSRHILANNLASNEDSTFYAAAKVPVIVARYAGSPQLLRFVDEAVSIQQDNQCVKTAARVFARLLERVILGNTVTEAFAWAKDTQCFDDDEKQYLLYFNEGFMSANNSPGKNGSKKIMNQFNFSNSESSSTLCRSPPFSLAVESIGAGGSLPASLGASLYGLRCFPTYQNAVRANIAAGGDSVSRSWVIGSLLAAQEGLQLSDNGFPTAPSCIPTEWIQKTTYYEDIYWLAWSVAGSNPHFNHLQEKPFCVMQTFRTSHAKIQQQIAV